MERGFARGMDVRNGAPSMERMDAEPVAHSTVARPVIVHVRNRYFSTVAQALL